MSKTIIAEIVENNTKIETLPFVLPKKSKSIINIPITGIGDLINFSFRGQTQTGLIHLNDVLEFMNTNYRHPLTGKKPGKKRIDDILSSRKFIEEAIALHCFNTGEILPPGISGMIKTGSKNRVVGIESLKLSTIKKLKGSHSGTYIHFSLLLTILSSYDGFITAAVKKIMVDSDILKTREDNKVESDALRKAIGRNTKFPKNRNIWMNVNKVIKSYLEYDNLNDEPVEILESRKQMCRDATLLVSHGVINDYYKLKDFFDNTVNGTKVQESLEILREIKKASSRYNKKLLKQKSKDPK